MENFIYESILMTKNTKELLDVVGKNVTSSSNAPKNEAFKEKCNYCHKVEHKKGGCRKLKVIQEKKYNHSVNVCYESNDKQKESS